MPYKDWVNNLSIQQKQMTAPEHGEYFRSRATIGPHFRTHSYSHLTPSQNDDEKSITLTGRRKLLINQ